MPNDLTTSLAKFLGSLVGREPAAMYQSSVTLTNAQIKALPTTGITVVDAQGANTVIVPVYGLVKVNTTAGAYTLSGESSWQFMLGSREVSGIVVTGTGLLNVAQSAMGHIPPDFGAPSSGVFLGLINGNIQALSDVANLPLKIKDDYNGVADYTGGNAANTAIVTVAYFVWNTTTGTLA